MMQDDDFVSGFLEGDPDTIECIRIWIRGAFTPYRARLNNELENIEQEILLELTEALRADRYRGSSRFRSYVQTYVHHKCIDRLRAHRRREWVNIDDLDLPAHTPTALDQLASSERLDIALRILEDMPESCRELWRMLESGMHYSEMSRRLGISEGTLRARVLRCRRKALEEREKIFSKIP